MCACTSVFVCVCLYPGGSLYDQMWSKIQHCIAQVSHCNEAKHHQGKGEVRKNNTKKTRMHHFLNQELHQGKHWLDEKVITGPRQKLTSSAWPAQGFVLADVRGWAPLKHTQISTSSFLIKLYTHHQHFLYSHASVVVYLLKWFLLLGTGSWSQWSPKTAAKTPSVALVGLHVSSKAFR